MTDGIAKDRLDKLRALRDNGTDPFPPRVGAGIDVNADRLPPRRWTVESARDACSSQAAIAKVFWSAEQPERSEAAIAKYHGLYPLVTGFGNKAQG